MTEFVPLNEDHAIQSVTWAVALDKPLDRNSIAAVQKNHFRWQAGLPAIELPQGFEIEITPQGSVARPASGNTVMFSFLRPDGTPAWALRFSGAEIAVECTRYTRWERIWPAARGYLESALEVVNGIEPDRKVTLSALRFVDKFRGTGEPYNLRTLFKPNLYIPEKIFAFNSLWHSHVGWFQSSGPNTVLQNINLDATLETLAPPTNGVDFKKPAIFVAVLHLQQIRYAAYISVATRPDYWPAPGLDDTQLGESSLPLELHRAQIPDRRVPSL
jgi:uncharacterized protein (TIGR04255 family)